ncbi:MAG TPA: hypothetical protein VGM13_15460 [Thermoanaerobaculia bacterium]|jgi:hypothetical protein
MSGKRKKARPQSGDPGDVTKELPGEYIAKLHLRDRPTPAVPRASEDVLQVKVRRKNIRTLRKEMWEMFDHEGKKAAFINARVADEWSPLPIPKGRPPVLTPEIRANALEFRLELLPWVRVIRRVQSKRRAGANERDIIYSIEKMRAAGVALPPPPYEGKSSPIRDLSLKWLVGRVFAAETGITGRQTSESVVDAITRKFYSPFGLPTHGSEPLRDLLRSVEKRRRRKTDAPAGSANKPPFTDKHAQRQRLRSEGEKAIPDTPAIEPEIPKARPRPHRRSGRRR